MVDDIQQNLQNFTLDDLARFTSEHVFSPQCSPDFRIFFSGQDDIHGVLYELFSRVTRSLYLSMYGFDDNQINDVIMQKVLDPNIIVWVSLDASQAGGKHERALLDADRQQNLVDFQTHFAIGQSPYHRILHTKAACFDDLIAIEGSVNLSNDGEGTFVIGSNVPGGTGYAAQANSLTVFTSPDAINRLRNRLITEHLCIQKQQLAKGG